MAARSLTGGASDGRVRARAGSGEEDGRDYGVVDRWSRVLRRGHAFNTVRIAYPGSACARTALALLTRHRVGVS